MARVPRWRACIVSFYECYNQYEESSGMSIYWVIIWRRFIESRKKQSKKVHYEYEGVAIVQYEGVHLQYVGDDSHTPHVCPVVQGFVLDDLKKRPYQFQAHFGLKKSLKKGLLIKKKPKNSLLNFDYQQHDSYQTRFMLTHILLFEKAPNKLLIFNRGF